MEKNAKPQVGVIFKGLSVSQLETIMTNEPGDDGEPSTYSDAARKAVAFYVKYKYAFKAEG
jgi:hypothetical protein